MNLKKKIQKRLRGNIYSTFPFDNLEKEEKYISIFTSKAQLPNGRVFEFNHYRNGNNLLIPNNASKILGFVNEFMTLYDHAANIEDYKLANFHQALQTLKELKRSGLLISQSEFLNKLTKSDSGHAPSSIDTLCWITRDRTESVKKSVESFAKNINGADKEYDFIVFDDSSLANYNKNKHNFELLNKKFGKKIRIIGRTERGQFLSKICEKLGDKVPRHVMEYGLMGLNDINHRCGANRNTFLLFTIGKYALTTDDDVFCQILKNGDEKKLTLTSEASFADVSSEFFTGQEELNSKIVFDHNNPVNIHQKLLGHSMGSLIKEYRNQINLSRITTNYIVNNLNTEKKIRVTMMGVAGDSGAGSPISKIFISGDKLVPLISNLENFQSKMFSRTVLQSHKSLTVGVPNFLLSMNLGFDNTELLPPFHPNFRNSDGIFASVLKKCLSNAYIGHLPYAISHISPEERPVDSSDLTSTLVRVPDMLKFSIDEFTNRTITAEEGLRALGVYLRDISQRSDNDLNEYLRLANYSFIANNINKVAQLHNKYKHINKQWAEIMEQRIEILYNSLRNENSIIQFKEIKDFSFEYQSHTIRRVYGNFGDLLYYWPDIYACVEKTREHK